MASGIDKGKQSRVFYYRQPLSSLEFNRVFSKTFPPGIYEGGDIEKIDDTTVWIKPISVIIEDSTGDSDIAVRIRTTEDYEFNVAMEPTRPMIIARFTWENSESNYLDFMQVSEQQGSDEFETQIRDLILGKLIFEPDGASYKIATENYIDYTRASRSFANPQEEFLKPFFTVRTPEGELNKDRVYVEGGKVLTTNGLVEFAGQYSPVISPTSNLNRHDYIYLDEDGEIKVQEGTPAETPKTKPFYARKVIAIIKRGKNRNDIKGNDIYGISFAERGEIKSTTILVKDAGAQEFFAKSDGIITIDMALRELWQKAVVIEGRATNLESDTVYKAGTQTITGVKTFSVNPKLLGSGGVLVPSDESHPINKKYYENTETGTGAVILGKYKEDQSEFNQDIYGTKTFTKSPKIPTTPEEDVSAINKKFLDSSASNVLHRTGNENLEGVKTFYEIPRVVRTDGEPVIPTYDSEVIVKSYYDSTGVKLTGAQSIGGVKTFNSSPKVPTNPADGISAINKDFLDSQNSSVVHKTENETIAGEKTFSTVPKLLDGINPLIPTVDSHVVTKKHLDDNVVFYTGNKDQTITGTKTFSKSPKVPTTPEDGDSVINKDFLASASSNVVHRTGNETVNGNKTFLKEIEAPSFYASSSRKVKENIKDANISALEILDKTKIVRYSYINDPDSYLHIGFIAEDTPEILTGKDSNVMALSDVCGVLIKAVQELRQEIEILKGEK